MSIVPLSKPRNVRTIREAAKLARMSRQNIHRLIHIGTLEAELVRDINWRGFYFIGADSLDKFLKQKKDRQ